MAKSPGQDTSRVKVLCHLAVAVSTQKMPTVTQKRSPARSIEATAIGDEGAAEATIIKTISLISVITRGKVSVAGMMS